MAHFKLFVTFLVTTSITAVIIAIMAQSQGTDDYEDYEFEKTMLRKKYEYYYEDDEKLRNFLTTEEFRIVATLRVQTNHHNITPVDTSQDVIMADNQSYLSQDDQEVPGNEIDFCPYFKFKKIDKTPWCCWIPAVGGANSRDTLEYQAMGLYGPAKGEVLEDNIVMVAWSNKGFKLNTDDTLEQKNCYDKPGPVAVQINEYGTQRCKDPENIFENTNLSYFTEIGNGCIVWYLVKGEYKKHYSIICSSRVKITSNQLKSGIMKRTLKLFPHLPKELYMTGCTSDLRPQHNYD